MIRCFVVQHIINFFCRKILQRNLTYTFALFISLSTFLGMFPFSLISSPEASAFLGGNRTLSFYHVHTKESLTVTFKRGGSYDREALARLNWFLRDWRRNEQIRMDPLLFDLLWDVQRQLGSSSPIHVLSPYRAPATNNALYARSRGVARGSQHTVGKAIDFFLSDVPSEKIRMLAIKMQRGGVGYYPSSRSRFIHLDVGSVRSWPRLPEAELVKLFPDGKTVHITKEGKPLRGYELARAEILSRGGAVLGSGFAASTSSAGETRLAHSGQRTLWGVLFGGDEDEDATEIASPSANVDVAYSSRSNNSFFLEEQKRIRQSSRATSTSETREAGFSAAEPTENESTNFAELDLPSIAPVPPQRTMAYVSSDAQGTTENILNGDDTSSVTSPLPPQRPVWDVTQEMTEPANENGQSAPIPPSRPTLLAYAPEFSLASGNVSPDILTTAMIPPVRRSFPESNSSISSNPQETDLEESKATPTILSSSPDTSPEQPISTSSVLENPKSTKLNQSEKTASFTSSSGSRYVASAPASIQGVSTTIPAHRAAFLLRNEPIYEAKMLKK